MKTRKGYKVYPLTNAQKFHYYYLDFSPKKEVLNIGTSLTIEVDLDWNVLKESIYEAYERNECMRVRFVSDKDGTHGIFCFFHRLSGKIYKFDVPVFFFRRRNPDEQSSNDQNAGRI